MPMRKLRRSATLFVLWPFLFAGLLLIALIGWQIYATLHHNTIFDAIRRNDAQSVEAFLRTGTDTNAREMPRSRSFQEAIDRRYSSWANARLPTPLLTALYHVEHSEKYGDSNLIINPHPNVRILRALLEHGANPNAQDTSQTSPLTYAVDSGSVEAAELLLRYGAKVNDNPPWNLPLLHAAGGGNVAMLRCLLDHGADIKVTGSNGETALIYAVVYGRQSECVRLLLSRQADVNAKDKRGKTALWYAQHPSPRLSVRQKQHMPEIITLLKQAGAQ